MMAVFLPNQSEKNPEQRAASQEPPAMEATMPPWTSASGPWQDTPGLGP